MDWDCQVDVLKALKILYNLQTADEREEGVTVYDNRQGFNAADASFLTSIAEQLFVHWRSISAKQYFWVHAKLQKYAEQICAFDLQKINLPASAVVHASVEKPDGLLYIDNKGYLRFKSEIYPSKQIKAYTFAWRDKKAWRGPLNQGNINAVVRMFPNLEKDLSVVKWEEKDAEHVLLAPYTEFLIDSGDAFPFQIEAIKFLIKRHKSMLCLAPGLGKTLCAILAAKDICETAHSPKILIVSPLSLLRNWQQEIKKWTDDESVIWHQNTSPDAQWVITNYDTVRTRMTHEDPNSGKKPPAWKLNKDYGFDIIIIDESILIKNRKSQRTRAIKALSNQHKVVWMLSGSPTSKNYSDLWSQLNILDSTHFSAFWRFTQNYCEVEKNQWGYQIYGNKKNAAEELHEDLEHIYYARTQNQVLPDLPDWIFESFDIPMAKDQERVYGEMEETFVAQLTDDNALLAPNILTQMLRLIQLASNPVLVGGKDVSAKWQAVMEMMQFVEKPVIIWTTFIDTADAIVERLLSKKYTAKQLTGRTDQASRQRIVDAFQAGEIDAIVAHPAVGKFGFTLTKARTAIYLERSYNGDDYYQSLYRVRRIGTVESPYIVHLLSTTSAGTNTIDHVIDRVLSYRKDSSLRLTSGLVREVLNE